MNSFEAAAIPTAIALIQAFQQFVANMGTDPAEIALKFPGASKVFVGTIEMQFPTLAVAELGAAQTDINANAASWITTLKAAQAAQAAAPAA